MSKGDCYLAINMKSFKYITFLVHPSGRIIIIKLLYNNLTTVCLNGLHHVLVSWMLSWGIYLRLDKISAVLILNMSCRRGGCHPVYGCYPR